jgi:hypothetical protein
MKHLKEWTQTEFLVQQAELEEQGIKVYLIDTILCPVEGHKTHTYNPIELKQAPKGSYFIFYCDTGKTTMDRLDEYATKFPDQHCISLKGGRSYWRANLKAETIHCLLTRKDRDAEWTP